MKEMADNMPTESSICKALQDAMKPIRAKLDELGEHPWVSRIEGEPDVAEGALQEASIVLDKADAFCKGCTPSMELLSHKDDLEEGGKKLRGALAKGLVVLAPVVLEFLSELNSTFPKCYLSLSQAEADEKMCSVMKFARAIAIPFVNDTRDTAQGNHVADLVREMVFCLIV